MAEKNKTCAACRGEIRIVNTVYWENCSINLCSACMALGNPELQAMMTTKTVAQLLKGRANPDAPTTGFEKMVREWIAEQE